MTKTILVICDGLADRPIRELGNKTPLEVAKTPNLDQIAIDGISGMMHPVDVGVRPGSDAAHLALFGYDPKEYYSGRGPFECLGIGMDLKSDDVALRANVATLDEQGEIIDRRAGRIDSTQSVVDYLGEIEIDGVKFIMKPGLSHRLGLIVRGNGLSHLVSNRDPKKVGVLPSEVKALDDTAQARFTAQVLNKFAQAVTGKLKDTSFNQERISQGLLPANTILFRGAGRLPNNLPSFKEKYGLHSAAIAAGPLYRGIAKALGMNIIFFPPQAGVTGKPDSNIKAKIDKAIELTSEYDFIFVHIKAADSLAEDGNFLGKVEFIEKIDQAIKSLVDHPEILVAITADHTTACELKIHTADPVPLTIRGLGVRTDDLQAYSERECVKGQLGHIRGIHLMPILVDILGLSTMYGA